MTKDMKYLVKFFKYIIAAALVPKSITNRLAKAKVINILDERLLEWRTLYLKSFIAFEDEFVKFPRRLRKGFFDNIYEVPNPHPSRGAALLQFTSTADANPLFIARINSELKQMNPKVLDYDTQTCMADVWDHLTYGMMAGTICAELKNLAGPPGSINQERLDYIRKEPPRSKTLSHANEKLLSRDIPSSTGPFQIYNSSWRMISDHHLPHKSFYIHGAYFFKLALAKHKMVMKAWASGDVPFKGIDPDWMTQLYQERDILAYLLLWRRYYGGAGSYYNLKDPDRPDVLLDGDGFYMRNLSFAITAISIMRAREAFLKHYPASPKDKSDPELWDIMNEANK